MTSPMNKSYAQEEMKGGIEVQELTPALRAILTQLHDMANNFNYQASRVEQTLIKLRGSQPSNDDKIDNSVEKEPSSYLESMQIFINKMDRAYSILYNTNNELETIV